MEKTSRGRPKRGGCSERGPHPPPKYKFKKRDFADTMVSNVSRDLPFSRNQTLKSADEQYTVILKNKIKSYKDLD
jgi:hypothetical protein